MQNEDEIETHPHFVFLQNLKDIPLEYYFLAAAGVGSCF